MLRSIRNGWRLITIARCLARNNALFPLEAVPQARPFLRLVRPLMNAKAGGRPGERLAAALQELGPTFIKFGQSLSTRADLLGAQVAHDLAMLQDRLPSFDAKAARETIEHELGAPVDELFESFDDKPAAAASIAQVHFASTTGGEAVAVKILRPGIERAIERDLDLLTWLAGLAERTQPHLRRYKPVESVAIFAASTRREMDLRLEAAAAAELADNCREDDGFRVPAVDWQRTGRRVVTFERVAGLRVDEREKLLAAGHDPNQILAKAARVFFNQVFRDGFFHGDMHPGNMLIDADGTIVAMDFGIMGRLDLRMRRHLAQILLGFLGGNYASVADVFIEAGFVPDDGDRLALVQACRAIGEPIVGKPLAEISFGHLLGQILAMANQFDMRTNPELLLLQKTMVVAEGVGRTLNPEVNMWVLAQPLVEDWIRINLGPEARIKDAVTDALDAARKLPELVRRTERLLDRALQPPPPRVTIDWRSNWLIPILLGLLLGLAFR